MATEFALERSDHSAIGSFDDVQSLLREVVPCVEFAWTKSGPEKLKFAAERGVEFPEALRKSLESLPSLLEGRAVQDDWLLQFGLGHSEPVMCLYITPHGASDDMQRILAEIETRVGGTMVVSGEEHSRVQ